jgi:hypothetical protein
MSEKKYVVPEGMYNAVIEVLPPHVRVQLSAMMGFPGVQRILEAALRWIVENPLLLTHEQREAVTDKFYDLDVPATERFNRMFKEYLKISFLSPETEQESAYMRVTKAMGAVTLSEEEGNKILEFVKGAIHAGYRTPEPAVPNLKYCPTCGVDTTPLGVPFSHSSPWGRTMPGHTELEIPEAVKDLGCTPEQVATLDGVYKEIAIRANNAIAEAYRRGLKGEK